MTPTTPGSRPGPETHDTDGPAVDAQDPTTEDTMHDATTDPAPAADAPSDDTLVLTARQDAEPQDAELQDAAGKDDTDQHPTGLGRDGLDRIHPGSADLPGGAAAAFGPTAAPPAAAQGIRVGTVVWGLVLAAVGIGLLAVASGVVFDIELALIGLVAAAGVALLVGSVVSGARQRER